MHDKEGAMNTGATSGRVYDALRHRLTYRALRPGNRIDPSELAKEFGSSVTPVRDALHILIGQGLVGTGVGEGFYVPHIDEPGLKDLYDWNLDLLLATLRRKVEKSPELVPISLVGSDPQTLTATLFAIIAQRSGSLEHALAMRWANARFAPVRLVEKEILADIEEELGALSSAISVYNIPNVRRLVVKYHNRRKRVAGHIIRALYRTPDNIPAI